MSDRESNIFWAGAHAGMAFALGMMAVAVALGGGFYEGFMIAAVLNVIAFWMCMRSSIQ